MAFKIPEGETAPWAVLAFHPLQVYLQFGKNVINPGVMLMKTSYLARTAFWPITPDRGLPSPLVLVRGTDESIHPPSQVMCRQILGKGEQLIDVTENDESKASALR